MQLFYRVQPSGLDIRGHRSETSIGERPKGIDVFLQPYQTLRPDGWYPEEGDEILVIRASRYWDNGDVEGVRIDPEAAETQVVARYPLADWLALWLSVAPSDDPEWDPESDSTSYEQDEAMAAHLASLHTTAA